MKDTD